VGEDEDEAVKCIGGAGEGDALKRMGSGTAATLAACDSSAHQAIAPLKRARAHLPPTTPTTTQKRSRRPQKPTAAAHLNLFFTHYPEFPYKPVSEEFPRLSPPKAVQRVHVNIVDLVDTKKTGKPVKIFHSLHELSRYTKETGKFFPKENAYADGVLKFLLRQILFPGHSDRGTRRRQ
jgi:hypothetical protein